MAKSYCKLLLTSAAVKHLEDILAVTRTPHISEQTVLVLVVMVNVENNFWYRKRRLHVEKKTIQFCYLSFWCCLSFAPFMTLLKNNILSDSVALAHLLLIFIVHDRLVSQHYIWKVSYPFSEFFIPDSSGACAT